MVISHDVFTVIIYCIHINIMGQGLFNNRSRNSVDSSTIVLCTSPRTQYGPKILYILDSMTQTCSESIISILPEIKSSSEFESYESTLYKKLRLKNHRPRSCV